MYPCPRRDVHSSRATYTSTECSQLRVYWTEEHYQQGTAKQDQILNTRASKFTKHREKKCLFSQNISPYWHECDDTRKLARSLSTAAFLRKNCCSVYQIRSGSNNNRLSATVQALRFNQLIAGNALPAISPPTAAIVATELDTCRKMDVAPKK